MKNFTCVLALLASLVNPASSLSPVPALLWSGKGYFTQSACDGSHEVSGSSLDAEQLVKGLNALSATSSISQVPPMLREYVSPDVKSNPNAVIGLIYPEMNSAKFSQLAGAYSSKHGSAAYLKDALSASESCVILPYVHIGDELNSMSNLLQQGMDGQVLSLHSTADEDSCSSILATLAGQAFPDDETTTVLIKIDNVEDFNGDCLKQITAHMSEATSNNYIALAVSNLSDCEISMDATESIKKHQRMLLEVDEASPALSATGNTGVLYMTPRILFGLMFMFFLMGVTLFALSLLGSINAPTRFPSANLTIAREY